jgi:2',3'-cyclic-nucleotide 2'-phosphodiesterase (5'-nucleotidase family)
VVVLLGHGGVGADATVKGDDQLLAAALRGVDLVLSGHTHQQPDAVLWATDLDGKQVPILQPAPYGLEVARAELVLEGGKATLDTSTTATRFLSVDDTILPTTDAGVLGELDKVIYSLESVPAGAGGSFLEQTLTLVETVAHGGVVTPVADVNTVIGDLFYRTVGHTDFDVPGLRAAKAGVRSGESAGLNLDTDAMWAVANNFSPSTTTTEIAVQASGPMRGDLKRGKTGQISFADVYNVVPLGGDPVEGTPGYPLVRFYLSAAEVWAAFEFTLLFSMQDSDFYLSPAGLEIAFDRSGAQFNPVTFTGGWITRMTLIDRAGVRTTIFDKSVNPTSGWLIDPTKRLVSVVTTLYVAAFAQSAGITPRDSSGIPVTDLNSTILGIPGFGAHWKDHQALAAYVAFLDASYWTLPSRYDERTAAGHVPQRVLCAGPVCP